MEKALNLESKDMVVNFISSSVMRASLRNNTYRNIIV